MGIRIEEALERIDNLLETTEINIPANMEYPRGIDEDMKKLIYLVLASVGIMKKPRGYLPAVTLKKIGIDITECEEEDYNALAERMATTLVILRDVSNLPCIIFKSISIYKEKGHEMIQFTLNEDFKRRLMRYEGYEFLSGDFY